MLSLEVNFDDAAARGGNAALRVEHDATEEGAEVRVPHPGLALRYYGGTMKPGATKAASPESRKTADG
jgi:hypothetical protein